MFTLNRKDLIAASLMAAIGLATIILSLGYDIGTTRRMGPGYFPVLLGAILVLLGIGIGLIDARKPPSEADRQIAGANPVNWRALLFLTAALAAFALLIEHAGLAPSLFISVFMASLADAQTRARTALVIATCMAAFCSVVFVMGLGLTIPIFGS